MRFRFLAILALPLLFAPACGGGEGSSDDGGGDAGVVIAEDVECICGTTRGDLVGCPHPLCDAGKNNPDNADCVCGSLTAGEDQ